MIRQQSSKQKNVIVASIAVSLSASAALVPVLSNIANVFPSFKDSLHLLLTIPPLMIMLVSAMIPFLNQRFSAKNLSIFAYTLLIISGVYPYFSNTFELLLFSRVLMGISLGILTPLSSSLAALYFESEEDMDKATGIQAAFASFGGILFSFLSGLAAQYFWKDVFLVQLLNLVPLFLILMFMSKERAVSLDKKPDFLIVKESLWINALALITIIATITFPLNMSLYIEEQALGFSTLAGTIGSMNSLIGFVIGLLFSRINHKLKMRTILLALFFVAASLGLMSLGTNLSGFYIASALFGLGTSLIMPSFVTLIYREVETKDVVAAISSLTIMMSVAQFISPYIINRLALFFGQSVSDRLSVATLIIGIEFLIVSFYMVRYKEKGMRENI